MCKTKWDGRVWQGFKGYLKDYLDIDLTLKSEPFPDIESA